VRSKAAAAAAAGTSAGRMSGRMDAFLGAGPRLATGWHPLHGWMDPPRDGALHRGRSRGRPGTSPERQRLRSADGVRPGRWARPCCESTTWPFATGPCCAVRCADGLSFEFKGGAGRL
jgi:hypothetical protein